LHRRIPGEKVLDLEGVPMRVVALIIFGGWMAIVALTGCSSHHAEEHGLPLEWISGG
jgi:hypothetical protein